jgi:hypothetical protein
METGMMNGLNVGGRIFADDPGSLVVVVESMTAIPAQIGADLYLVRHEDFDKRAVLDCPCGCKRRIDLNLVRTQK